VKGGHTMIPINYDNFYIEEIEIPQRSKLYCLEPIGMGTPYVESLTSYISRLAENHNLNLTTLVCKTFTPYIKTESRIKSFLNGSLGPKAEYINGNSSVSLEYISALEELTLRNDLIYLTMNSWSGIFSNSVIGKSRKWCPNCLKDARDNGKEVYEPLIWYVKDIHLCDKHNVILEDKCPQCEKKLGFLHANYIVGHCQYCLTWLGKESNNSIKCDEYQTFLVSSFKSLILNSNRLNALPTNLRIGFVLNKILDINDFNSIREFADYLEVNQTLLRTWIRNINKRKPTIKMFYKIYKKTNLSIYELIGECCKNKFEFKLEKPQVKKYHILTDDQMEEELRKELETGNYESLNKLCTAKGFGIRRAKKNFPDLCRVIDEKNFIKNKEKNENIRKFIKLKLLEALEKDPPISLAQFSKDYGPTEIMVKNYCPELSMKLINRYSSYIKKKSKIRTESIKAEIKKVVLELHREGIYPSDKSMRRKLSNPFYIVEPKFRKIWKEELVLLGYK
jgi:transcriptional regulator with XRE-family HTH domain